MMAFLKPYRYILKKERKKKKKHNPKQNNNNNNNNNPNFVEYLYICCVLTHFEWFSLDIYSPLPAIWSIAARRFSFRLLGHSLCTDFDTPFDLDKGLTVVLTS
jgi:hypothetical protein